MNMRRPHTCGVLVGALALGLALANPAAGAQTKVLDLAGAAPGDLFGWAVASIGDVDGDRADDLAVGSQGARPNGVFQGGEATVLSGRTGAVLFRFLPDGPSEFVGTSVGAAGDVDRDGVPDVLVGASGVQVRGAPTGYVRVFSGADGSALLTVRGVTNLERFGDAVASVGDVTRDGVPDFVVGAPGVTGVWAGAVRLFSGADGAQLCELTGDEGSNLGHAVAGIGDVNRDGVPDFAVGAPAANPRGRRRAGLVRIVSGQSPCRTLRTLNGSVESEGLGYALASAGRANRRARVDELIVGAPFFARGGRRLGRAVLFAATSGATIRVLVGTVEGGFFGTEVAGVGDVDGDGRADVAVGAEVASTVTVFSRRARRKRLPALFTYTGAPADLAGDAIAGGDVNGDGTPDVILGAWGGSPACVAGDLTPCDSAGYVQAYSLR